MNESTTVRKMRVGYFFTVLFFNLGTSECTMCNVMAGEPSRNRASHGDRDRDWALAAGSRAGPCSAGHWHGLNLGSLKAQARAGGGLSARHRFR